MTLENHLEILSHDNERNLKLFHSWGIIKRLFTQKLESVCIYFPHFSLHNATHSETICMQIEKILGEEGIKQLCPTDTWMLLVAIWGHDIGMAVEYSEVYQLFKTAEFDEKLHYLASENLEFSKIATRILNSNIFSCSDNVSKYIQSLQMFCDIQVIIENFFRDSHAKKSSEYIKLHPEMFVGIPERFVLLLGDICEMHQNNICEILSLPYKSNGMSSDYMHPRLIAALLCLGDLLDLDNDRFNESILDSASPMPQVSHFHLQKHKSVKNFLVEMDRIEIEFDTENIEVYRLMRDWCGWIEESCNFLLLNWDTISPKGFIRAPSLRKKELLLNHSNKWIELSNLRFSIDKDDAIRILQGSSIYENSFISIRETIQNAVDASIIQIWKSISDKDPGKYNKNINPSDLDPNEFIQYQIEVNIIVNKKNNVEMSIRDKGTGISIQELEEIARIGNKKRINRSAIVKTMPKWLAPSGEFGLGLQSVFLLTDRFEIVTKTEDEPAKKITLESGSIGKGYILVEDYQNTFARGTMVRFEIDSSRITINDLFCSEYEYKTSPKCNLIIERIISLYDNISKRVYKNDLDMNYVPLVMYCFIPFSGKLQKIREQKCIFQSMDIFRKNGFFINSNVMSCEFFVNDTSMICKIAISGEQNDNNVYSKYSQHFLGLRGNLYFKNAYVKHDMLNSYRIWESGLYRLIDFHINIIGYDAGKILTISRNEIEKSYIYEFRQKSELSIKVTIEKMIDNAIQSEIANGEIIIKLYQLSRIYCYRTDGIYDKFKNILNKARFEYYYDINGNNKIFSFPELNANTLFLLDDNMDASLFSEFEGNEIIDLSSSIDRICSLLDDKGKSRNYYNHIVNHRLKKIFIAKVFDKFYVCYEVVPFETTSPYDIFDKDKFIMMHDFVCAIYYKHRCMKANRNFKEISTPTEWNLSYDFLHSHNEMVIEMPFVEDHREMIMTYIGSKNMPLDINGFIGDICRMPSFLTNVGYISEYSKIEANEIELRYKDWIVQNIELVTQDKFSLFLSHLMKEFSKHQNQYQGIYHDKMDGSHLITY